MSPHQPIRTCIGCGQKKLKAELLRIVRTPQKRLEIDQKAKNPGRGAYLCYNTGCFKTAIKKGRINRSLKIEVPIGFYEELLKLLDRKDSIIQKKRKLRSKIEKQRRQFSRDWVNSKSSIIINHLKKLPEFQSAQTIHCYVAWRNEVNTHGLIKELLQMGRTVVVPVVDLLNHSLLHSKITDFSDLKPGTFGILEPTKTQLLPIKLSVLDLIIVPGVAFDLTGHRIGFGGGYYDEFLRKVKTTKIGLTFHFQIVDKIPTQNQDQRVDIIISEKGVFKKLAFYQYANQR